MNRRTEAPLEADADSGARRSAAAFPDIVLRGIQGEALGLGGAVRRLRAAQRAPDDRAGGVLLWYSLSGALAAAVVLDGTDPGAGLEVRLGGHGFVEAVRAAAGPATATAAGPATATAGNNSAAAENLGLLFRGLIPRIAAVSGARERTLWAIATDSLAAAALRGGGDPRETVELLLAACGPDAPAARFEAVAGRPLLVRRGSCCLLYQCAAGTKCLSCPRQLPADRRRRLGGGT